MPRFQMIRVTGSHAMSTSLRCGVATVSVVAIVPPSQGDQCGSYPVFSAGTRLRHFGSVFAVALVIARSLRISNPYGLLIADDRCPPGGSSMKGMNLSGKPGIVQAMQMPPTFGQPPM